ncbi:MULTISPECIES: MCE family protein [Mycobacterium]|uniref:Mammalian cell entry protein n=1 Tax=Mycobacterium kiyosense TaxID=2871094 RepID=A0A9P3Q9L8_9MYCO|nr:MULTISPECIES: MlaD family protein [Mycobacterium]BDB41725.1 mammalian cell entry protein [Mycobacterium kiyosense]BDE14982.1 mammalian cell entry protein [Mycobacterium sp. 20KCMC460]GLB83656.1 mammalian cell entry protein [Mycobacterium kiyosense]GLB87756.1 mammalian cell entry protein [Mycobacterium kiyosense]GLB97132.1 mammalian cell entry protein [Mycobacterium kiyosense]
MLRLNRKTWIQLAVLFVVTIVSCGAMAFNYMKLPETLFGIGEYTVSVDLPQSGGLYENSVVTYRGTDVGQVKSVNVTATGVRAVLALRSGVKVPADVQASVHSRSAIGEQYIELTPLSGQQPESGTQSGHARSLGNGDVISAGHVDVPVDIGRLLDMTNRALQAIPRENLRTVINESDRAVAGLGPELSRIVDGSTALAIAAGQNVGPLTTLIDQAPPVLNSQVQTADAIATWAHRTAAITAQFQAQDAALRDLLRQGSSGLEEGRTMLDRVAPAVPVLFANLVSLGDIAVVYRHDIEQILVLAPQGIAVMAGSLVPNTATKQDYRGFYLDFNLNMNLPPPCTTGFLPPTQRRSPASVDAPDRPAAELYCRLPQDSELNVRGARNIPCETKPWKRAPTVEMCESDEEYVPLNDGYNWKGDPNATTTGQGVPQYPPGQDPRLPPPRGTAPAPVPPPAPVAVATYDPATGDYVGPDGHRYTESDLAHPRAKNWQSLLVPTP